MAPLARFRWSLSFLKNLTMFDVVIEAPFFGSLIL